jgi:hypothetical protein
MNTCIICLGTVTLTTTGALVLVGESFLPMAPHVHETTATLSRTVAPLAA